MDRRKFLANAGLAAGAIMMSPLAGLGSQSGKTTPSNRKKLKLGVVGTGIRGVMLFGRELLRDFGDHVELVGMMDVNPGRLRFADGFVGAGCPVFTDLREMIRKQKPEALIIASVDSVHHQNIIDGMEMGCDIICEKPLTTDEHKAQAIIDVQKRTGRKMVVTFNYRYPPYRAKMKELIMGGLVGQINTVDFHWNINHSHLNRYMQRWHGEMQHSGSLWIHKSSHHFDLINWYLNSEPQQVYAHSYLDRFGRRGPFRGNNCRDCQHTAKCPYYWDILQQPLLKGLYVDNEHYDGYIRDNCVFRRNIDTFERHSAVIKYMNGVMVNYSLTGDTDFDGYWVAFNGTKGRLEARLEGYPVKDYAEMVFTPIERFTDRKPQIFRVDLIDDGYWGGDALMMDHLLVNPDKPDPLGQKAFLRDGIMSVLPGIAARRSALTGKPVDIKGLTSIEPQAFRPTQP